MGRHRYRCACFDKGCSQPFPAAASERQPRGSFHAATRRARFLRRPFPRQTPGKTVSAMNNPHTTGGRPANFRLCFMSLLARRSGAIRPKNKPTQYTTLRRILKAGICRTRLRFPILARLCYTNLRKMRWRKKMDELSRGALGAFCAAHAPRLRRIQPACACCASAAGDGDLLPARSARCAWQAGGLPLRRSSRGGQAGTSFARCRCCASFPLMLKAGALRRLCWWAERVPPLPATLCGKPLRTIGLSSLWGVAL